LSGTVAVPPKSTCAMSIFRATLSGVASFPVQSTRSRRFSRPRCQEPLPFRCNRPTPCRFLLAGRLGVKRRGDGQLAPNAPEHLGALTTTSGSLHDRCLSPPAAGLPLEEGTLATRRGVEVAQSPRRPRRYSQRRCASRRARRRPRCRLAWARGLRETRAEPAASARVKTPSGCKDVRGSGQSRGVSACCLGWIGVARPRVQKR
jgi:hypothetical protein